MTNPLHNQLGSLSTLACSAGRASMVDIRGKDDTHRYALASGKVYLGQTAYELVRDNQLKKGDVLTVAQLAGVSHVAVLFDPK